MNKKMLITECIVILFVMIIKCSIACAGLATGYASHVHLVVSWDDETGDCNATIYPDSMEYKGGDTITSYEITSCTLSAGSSTTCPTKIGESYSANFKLPEGGAVSITGNIRIISMHNGNEVGGANNQFDLGVQVVIKKVTEDQPEENKEIVSIKEFTKNMKFKVKAKIKDSNCNKTEDGEITIFTGDEEPSEENLDATLEYSRTADGPWHDKEEDILEDDDSDIKEEYVRISGDYLKSVEINWKEEIEQENAIEEVEGKTNVYCFVNNGDFIATVKLQKDGQAEVEQELSGSITKIADDNGDDNGDDGNTDETIIKPIPIGEVSLSSITSPTIATNVTIAIDLKDIEFNKINWSTKKIQWDSDNLSKTTLRYKDSGQETKEHPKYELIDIVSPLDVYEIGNVGENAYYTHNSDETNETLESYTKTANKTETKTKDSVEIKDVPFEADSKITISCNQSNPVTVQLSPADLISKVKEVGIRVEYDLNGHKYGKVKVFRNPLNATITHTFKNIPSNAKYSAYYVDINGNEISTIS